MSSCLPTANPDQMEFGLIVSKVRQYWAKVFLLYFFRGAGPWLSWLQSWMQTWPEKRAWLCYVGYRGETRWLADRKWQYAPRRVEVRSAVIERQLIGYIPEKGTQVITKWSPSGQQVVTKWSPSVYLVVTMWSTSHVVTKWSPSDLDGSHR